MALEFFITYRGVRIESDEPALNWLDIDRVYKRSSKYSGITYLVTSELEFVGNFINIIDQIKSNGIAEKAILEIFRKNDETLKFEEKFTGLIDIIGSVKTISATGREVYKVNTKPTGFEVDFDNNFDVPVNITDDTDLFGNAMNPFARPFDYIKLEPLSIALRLDISNEIPNSFDGGSQLEIDSRPDNYAYFWTMNFGAKTIQEFDDNFQDNATLVYDDFSYHPDIEISDLDLILDSPNSPVNNNLEVLKVPTDGDYRIRFDYSHLITVDLASVQDEILRYQYTMMVVIVNRTDPLNPVVTLELLDKDVVENFDNDFLEFTKSGSIDKTFTLKAKDDIYIFPSMLLRIFGGSGSSTATIDVFNINFTILSLKIDGVTQFEETNPTSYLVHELFSRLTNKITGKFNAFSSDFYGRTDSQPVAYGSDGDGSLTAILDGTHIRGFKIGTGGEENRALNLSWKDFFESEKAKHNIDLGIIDGKVVVAKNEFFHDKTEFIDLGCIRDLEISTDPKKFHNNVEVGYSEFKNSENKSGAGLQEFNARTNHHTQLSEINSKYSALSKYIAGGYPIETTRRQQRSLDTEKETQFDLKKFMIALLRTGTAIDDATEEDPAFVNETYDPGDSENPWENISGVDFPEEVYNARWQPGRIARAHGNILRTSTEQSANDELLVQDIQGNDQFSSQLKTELNPVNEGDNIPGSELGDPLFNGDQYKFTHPLADEQIELYDANPYIAFRLEDANGKEYKGWIEGKLAINFNTNEADFVLNGFDDDEPVTEKYDFHGNEKITVSDIPAFERTSTFYLRQR